MGVRGSPNPSGRMAAWTHNRLHVSKQKVGYISGMPVRDVASLLSSENVGWIWRKVIRTSRTERTAKLKELRIVKRKRKKRNISKLKLYNADNNEHYVDSYGNENNVTTLYNKMGDQQQCKNHRGRDELC